MRPCLSFFLLILLVAVRVSTVSAQTCTGSLGDPVVDEDFGICTSSNGVGPPLSSGVTTLQYSSDPCSEDGDAYGLTTFIRGCHAGTWHNVFQDHTGVYNGMFMVINGPSTPEVVYTQRVKGSTLCPNTTYEFAAYIMNILKLSPDTKDFVPPNLTFSIETASGEILKTIPTGDIPETTDPQWNQYGTFFTSPSDGSDVLIKLTDNQTLPGFGNDFAVDDITFKPCGPIIQVGFNTLGNTATQQTCASTTNTYTFVARQQGYPNPAYQWQVNTNNTGWVDVAGETGTTLTTALNDPAAGTYQYRIGVLSDATSSLSCRIYSQPLIVLVNPLADALSPTTTVCVRQLIQLRASQGNTYHWTGPNGFSSAEQEPLVDESAQLADSGLYTVTITLNGCPSISSTRVQVFPPVQAVVSKDTVICQGTAATLTAAQSQNVTTYNWSPSIGLDNPNAATVIASPQQTTTYTLSLAGACSTIATDITVTVLNKAVANAGPNKHLMAGDSVKLNGSVKGDSVRYYWTPATHLDNPNSLTPIANPPNNMLYTLHAQSIYNCSEDTSNVFIRVYQKLTIPNTFTPNNDGINDTWDIKNLITYPQCSIMVFDRYGQQVYQSNGYSKSWDGKNNGKTVTQGTYYYLIDLNNGMPKISGWLLILH